MKTIKHVISRIAIGLAFFGIVTVMGFFPEFLFGMFVAILILLPAYVIGCIFLGD